VKKETSRKYAYALGSWRAYLTKRMLCPLFKIVGLVGRIKFLKTTTMTMKMTALHVVVFWASMSWVGDICVFAFFLLLFYASSVL
jgi:hypothetical protein